MDTKTRKLVEDVCSLYEDRPAELCNALRSMLEEHPNPYSPFERSAINYALRKASGIATKWSAVDMRVQLAEDEKARLLAKKPLPLENSLENLLKRFEEEERRLRASYAGLEAHFNRSVAEVDGKIKALKMKRDTFRVDPVSMVDGRFLVRYGKDE